MVRAAVGPPNLLVRDRESEAPVELNRRDDIPSDEIEPVIHSVANSRRDFAVAAHVYGGDFFSVERSEWDFETYEERPRDFARARRLFDEANARWRDQA